MVNCVHYYRCHRQSCRIHFLLFGLCVVFLRGARLIGRVTNQWLTPSRADEK